MPNQVSQPRQTSVVQHWWCDHCNWTEQIRGSEDGPFAECIVCNRRVEEYAIVPADDWRRAEKAQGEMERVRAAYRAHAEEGAEALRQTVDLCNAMREYAPTLNLAAETRLRESLALLKAVAVRPARHGGVEATSLAEAAELAVTALMPIVPIRGSWEPGYEVEKDIYPKLIATVEEWAEAAWAVAELQRWVP